jgi:hypothetical protein
LYGIGAARPRLVFSAMNADLTLRREKSEHHTFNAGSVTHGKAL